MDFLTFALVVYAGVITVFAITVTAWVFVYDRTKKRGIYGNVDSFSMFIEVPVTMNYDQRYVFGSVKLLKESNFNPARMVLAPAYISKGSDEGKIGNIVEFTILEKKNLRVK